MPGYEKRLPIRSYILCVRMHCKGQEISINAENTGCDGANPSTGSTGSWKNQEGRPFRRLRSAVSVRPTAPLLPVHRPPHPSHPLQFLRVIGPRRSASSASSTCCASPAGETDVDIRLADEAVAVAPAGVRSPSDTPPAEQPPQVQGALPARRQLAQLRCRKETSRAVAGRQVRKMSRSAPCGAL